MRHRTLFVVAGLLSIATGCAWVWFEAAAPRPVWHAAPTSLGLLAMAAAVLGYREDCEARGLVISRRSSVLMAAFFVTTAGLAIVATVNPGELLLNGIAIFLNVLSKVSLALIIRELARKGFVPLWGAAPLAVAAVILYIFLLLLLLLIVVNWLLAGASFLNAFIETTEDWPVSAVHNPLLGISWGLFGVALLLTARVRHLTWEPSSLE